MTFREYENLQVGDKVILPFSSEKEQIVINANSDMVMTKSIGSAHNSIIYTNGYQTIELYNTIDEEKLYELAKENCPSSDSYGEWYIEGFITLILTILFTTFICSFLPNNQKEYYRYKCPECGFLTKGVCKYCPNCNGYIHYNQIEIKPIEIK